MKLSVIVPSIRPQNIKKLYDSIVLSFSGLFEFIVIGPYPPPIQLKINWINSLRSPNACQQQGLCEAKGDYVTWGADDGTFMPDALDEAFSLIDDDYKNIVVGKYTEGPNPKGMDDPDYYRFGFHKAYRLKGLPQSCWILNCGLISRRFITELGGWDASLFDVPTIAHADLGIRAYKAGAKFILQEKLMFTCGHMPGRTGDHAPIHNAMKDDLRVFKKIYSSEIRPPIYLDNWQYTEEKWNRRFR